jgi:hypothetical protein
VLRVAVGCIDAVAVDVRVADAMRESDADNHPLCDADTVALLGTVRDALREAVASTELVEAAEVERVRVAVAVSGPLPEADRVTPCDAVAEAVRSAVAEAVRSAERDADRVAVAVQTWLRLATPGTTQPQCRTLAVAGSVKTPPPRHSVTRGSG